MSEHITETVSKDQVIVQERYIRPSPEYPDGSYLRSVGGQVEIATGQYAELYPGKPSLYWHGGPPFTMMDVVDVPWKHRCVFDSEVYCLRYQYSSRVTRGVYAPRDTDVILPVPRYSGAVELRCECGKQRLFTPSDGQPTASFWGGYMGKPNPPLDSQPPHLAWEINLR